MIHFYGRRSMQALKASFIGKHVASPYAMILKNGRSLSWKDDPEGEASYLNFNLPIRQKQCISDCRHYEHLRTDKLSVQGEPESHSH